MEEAKRVGIYLKLLDILEFSFAASETFGKLSIDLKKKGNDIGDFDLLIASIALTMGNRFSQKMQNTFPGFPGLAVETY